MLSTSLLWPCEEQEHQRWRDVAWQLFGSYFAWRGLLLPLQMCLCYRSLWSLTSESHEERVEMGASLA